MGQARARLRRASAGRRRPCRPRPRRRHRNHHRRRRGRPARSDARSVRGVRRDAGSRRLERSGPRRAGLSETRRAGAGVAGRPGAPPGPAHSGAPGEGCLLGQRDQARSGARSRRLSRFHPQGGDRHVVPGLRPRDACRRPGALSAIRDPQRPFARRHRHAGGRAARLRIPAAARHGRGAARDPPRHGRRADAHLRAGRQPRGSARLSRAPPARERRQHVLREPSRRRRSAARRHRRRSGRTDPRRNPKIALPKDILGARRNSSGFLWSDPTISEPLLREMDAILRAPHSASPIVDGVARTGTSADVRDPADRRRVVGTIVEAQARDAQDALASAHRAQAEWDAAGGKVRGGILLRAADLFEKNRALLMALAVREAGKTLPNALGEVREAVDFLRYYAVRAAGEFAEPVALPGPTGESNELSLHGRGVFACISPWNFPLSIFTGQVAGALAAGNGVLAKPAEQTPLIAAATVRLLHEAGVPPGVLHLLPGDGPRIGAALFADPLLAGVAFTGSTDAAKAINRALAARSGPIATLIAETGGQNAMIVDSTALPEQVARDALASAFDSAGQRCSALRVLFVQDDVADRMLNILLGAMDELKLGDPMRLDTDVGPVIDEDARAMLERHVARMTGEAKLLRKLAVPAELSDGVF